jgi:sigma-B regulation protein RsbU (phosphoserine phosphatase)
MMGFISPDGGITGRSAYRKAPLILIVDDDFITRQVLEGVLQGAGFETLSAPDVAGAWMELESHRPDLILLDVFLPDGMGFDVCRSLQERPETSHIPVLFISANEDVSSKVRGFESGGVDYIPKPLAGAEVIARVTTHLRLKYAYERLAELQAERIGRLALSQQALMPRSEDYPEARFHVSLNQVLQAGGDFYDVIPVGPQIMDYVVADASGHDLGASFWTASLKTLLSEYATPLNSPREIVHSVNKTLVKILPEGVFFTAIYARLNRSTGRLTLVNAGHPPALIFSLADRATRVLRQEGDVIGAFDDAEFSAEEVSLGQGDRFFLYSDGLVEISGSFEKGIHRLIEACNSFQDQPFDRIALSIVSSVTGDVTPLDDTVLMGVEV